MGCLVCRHCFSILVIIVGVSCRDNLVFEMAPLSGIRGACFGVIVLEGSELSPVFLVG